VDIANTRAEAAIEDRTSLESLFALHYSRIARTIALVTGDRSRAEELAVEVFLDARATSRTRKAGFTARLRISPPMNCEGDGAEAGVVDKAALETKMKALAAEP
jgi:hypothetical protein